MRIKKFRAGSMREALMLIRQELGEDAVILKTERVSNGFLSLGGKSDIEVTAGIDDGGPKKTQTFDPLKMAEAGVYNHPHHQSKRPPVPEAPPVPVRPIGQTQPERTEEVATADRSRDTSIFELRRELNELKAMVRSVVSGGGKQEVSGELVGGWELLYTKLTESEVKPQVAKNLINEVRESYESAGTTIDETFSAALAASFPVTGPLRPRSDGPLTVAFVGPTGAGKTTTLAKLAAHFVANKGMSVSIITSDTYRIAAIEQIRTFADIVGVGLQVVFSPNEVRMARSACHNDDIVLIDTAGRSQKNREHMDELREMLHQMQPDQTHLVLSATTKDSDLNDIIKRYRTAGVNRLLFTKLDETVRLGNILNTVAETGIPVSYFATGQSVPDDIEVAHAARFVQRLWEGVER